MRGYVIGLVAALVSTATLSEALAAQGGAPRILSLDRTSAPVGSGAITLTVNGEHFGNAEQGTFVRWNGVNRNTTYVSETQLRAEIPTTDLDSAGTMQVTVYLERGGGVTSAPATFTVNNPRPVLRALSSSAKAVGTAFVLTVTGNSFARGAAVHWNGAARTTTRVDSTRLTVNLSATDLASPGNYSITVVNPAPGGGASAARSFSVVDPPRITAFYIGGPGNPKRVWAGEAVPLDVMRAGTTPTHWRVAPSASALATTAWQGVAGVASYKFPLWRANDCGLIDSNQYRHAEQVHFQYAAAVGSDTITSTSASDSVVVRLPWCSPITVNPPVAWAGFLTPIMGRSVCPLGTLMTGVRVRTAEVTLWALSKTNVVTAVGAVCGGTSGPVIGTSEGLFTVNANFGSIASPFVEIVAKGGLDQTLGSIAVLNTPLPGSLEGGIDYPALYARVIDGNVSGGSGAPWTLKCPNGTAPIGMYVYQNAAGRASGLSFLCARPDN